MKGKRMRKESGFVGLLSLALVALGFWISETAQAGTKTWKVNTTGDWFTAANWVESAYPTNGDSVVITNVGSSVLLTNSTEYLGSLTLSAPGSSSNILIFSNWNTTISATNITIRTNGVVTLPGAFTNNVMSNNVYIVCSNLTVDAGGAINVDGRGWIGRSGVSTEVDGLGPGAGAGALLGGGGHGGFGGYCGLSNGLPYGVINAPICPGSSGHGGAIGYGGDGTGGSGGGAIRIMAGGVLTVNGLISANGGNSSGNAGGGSGGSIYITCGVISGTTGVIQANGGIDTAGTPHGQGGGGRIAIVYNTTLQAAVSVPTIQYQVATGGPTTTVPGDIGTLYFPDIRLLPETMNSTWSGQILIQGTNWVVNNLTISNGWVRFPQDGFNLIVSNNLLLNGSSARLQVGGVVFRVFNTFGLPRIFSGGVTASVLNVGGNVTLTNGGSLFIYAAETNAGTSAFGAFVSVAGDMYVGSNSWVYPQSHPTNGGSVRFQVRNLTVEGVTNGGFDANAPRGFAAGIVGHLVGFGPGGGGVTDVGGGYGGLGGGANGIYGQTYGSSNAPADPGSGGYYSGVNQGSGSGGGLVYLLASRTVTLRGILRANGMIGNSYGNTSGAGSGGGIFIRCKTFIGSTMGSLEANGGSGYYRSGTGGGGRIAVWRISDQSEGPVGTSVTNGVALNNPPYVSPLGAPGTIVWGWMPPPGTVFYGR